jgi:hypothetical protein
MTGLSQVFVQEREDGHANHRHGDGDLQDLERFREQHQCTQTRTNDGEDDDGSSNRLRLRTLPMNGKEPPTLIQAKASILVATATCASMSRAIITGTVMRDVLPVTKRITLAKKNTD